MAFKRLRLNVRTSDVTRAIDMDSRVERDLDDLFGESGLGRQRRGRFCSEAERILER